MQCDLSCVVKNIKVQMDKVYQPFSEMLQLGKRKAERSMEEVVQEVSNSLGANSINNSNMPYNAKDLLLELEQQ